MNQPAKAQEPSMEEILASIRRIISDDETVKPAAAAAKPAETPRAAAPAPRAPIPQPAPRAAAPAAIRPVAAPAPAPVEEPKNPDQSPEDDGADIDSAKADDGDILELTESMAAPKFKTIDSQPDVVFADPAPEPEIAARPAQAPRPSHHATEQTFERELMSNATTAAVDSAFNTLAQTVLIQNARTLEDLVREMLRPMLKSWLDDNLPGLVERLVRAEIERVARGRHS